MLTFLNRDQSQTAKPEDEKKEEEEGGQQNNKPVREGHGR
jgi:hypothetical protein